MFISSLSVQKSTAAKPLPTNPPAQIFASETSIFKMLIAKNVFILIFGEIWMTKKISEGVIIAILTAVVLGALTLIWNWASAGGVVRVLGGVSKSEVVELLNEQRQPIVDQVKAELRVGTEVIPAPGGNGQSTSCPEGTIMVGALWQSDSGGPSGILSWISPICRTLGK